MGAGGDCPPTIVKIWAALPWKGHESWKDHVEESGMSEGETSEFKLMMYIWELLRNAWETLPCDKHCFIAPYVSNSCFCDALAVNAFSSWIRRVEFSSFCRSVLLLHWRFGQASLLVQLLEAE